MNDNFDVETWKKEKNQERKEVYTLINNEALQIFKSPERLKQYLDTQARFDMYSVNNAILVSKQKPDAIQLKSRQEWRKQGAYINKGVQGISILEPSNRYVKADGTSSVSFNVKKMIDVTDTNVNFKPINKVYDNKLILKALFNKSPFDIESTEDMANDINAYWDKNDEVLYIRKEGIKFPDGIHEIVKEMAKASLETDDSPELKEFKCKCTSYLVCKNFNLDVSSFNFDNIPSELSNLTSKGVKQELGEIRNGMTKINERADKFFETKSKNRKRDER